MARIDVAESFNTGINLVNLTLRNGVALVHWSDIFHKEFQRPKLLPAAFTKETEIIKLQQA
jgi:hypothetical protein